MRSQLEVIVNDLAEAPKQERIELLIDLAKSLPQLPDRFQPLKNTEHRVEECQSPVYLFAEVNGDHVSLYADVPVEAPTVRGFVSMLVEGLDGATVDEVLDVPADLVQRAGMPEILGMLRLGGLHGVLRRLKSEVLRAARVVSAG